MASIFIGLTTDEPQIISEAYQRGEKQALRRHFA